jgi:sodium/hydrogen antiporter
MGIEEAFKAFNNYDLWLLIIGLAILAISILPRILVKHPLSAPIILLGLGYAAIALPLGLEAPKPLEQGDITEHLTELGVIIALMGAGLKIDRPVGLKAWSGTWRLLSITMMLSILFSVFVGLWIAAFVPATAMLLGAVIAPTDPVLASEVQVGAPNGGSEDKKTEKKDKTAQGEEDEVRFLLTSEAGLNDGLAFPFTNMAIAMAIAGTHPENWIGAWLLVDVLYKMGVGFLVGILLGYVLARVIFAMPAKTNIAKAMVGLNALATTLIVYGATQYAGGYGFIATFVAAVTIRSYERIHEYHEVLHVFNEKAERILTAGILVALGGAVAGGLLDPLTWPLVISAFIIVFIVRPLSGALGLIGFSRAPWRERFAVSFFGIRGIGSFYYLAYALNEEEFPGAEELWALVGLVIVISIIVHGITAAPVTNKLDALREKIKSQ